jgi:hypothetical protein
VAWHYAMHTRRQAFTSVQVREGDKRSEAKLCAVPTPFVQAPCHRSNTRPGMFLLRSLDGREHGVSIIASCRMDSHLHKPAERKMRRRLAHSSAQKQGLALQYRGRQSIAQHLLAFERSRTWRMASKGSLSDSRVVPACLKQRSGVNAAMSK